MNKRMIHLRGVTSGATVYVSGPMTIKKEECYNFEEFFYWSRILRRSGYDVINPAQIDCEKMFRGWTYSEEQYEDVIADDLVAIKDRADAVFAIHEWQKSPGANREIATADDKGIPVFYAEDFD